MSTSLDLECNTYNAEGESALRTIRDGVYLVIYTVPYMQFFVKKARNNSKPSEFTTSPPLFLDIFFLKKDANISSGFFTQKKDILFLQGDQRQHLIPVIDLSAAAFSTEQEEGERKNRKQDRQ